MTLFLRLAPQAKCFGNISRLIAKIQVNSTFFSKLTTCIHEYMQKDTNIRNSTPILRQSSHSQFPSLCMQRWGGLWCAPHWHLFDPTGACRLLPALFCPHWRLFTPTDVTSTFSPTDACLPLLTLPALFPPTDACLPLLTLPAYFPPLTLVYPYWRYQHFFFELVMF